MKRNTLSLAIGLGCALASSSASADPVKVVTSIKPVELLVKAVAGDAAQVTTLVAPGASPHNYTMKPSQRRALQQADAIFWVGPEMETFLQRLLSSEEFDGRVHAFMEPTSQAAGHHREKIAESAAEKHDEHDHGAHTEHAGHHDHEEHNGHESHATGHHHHGSDDPHIWLDPQRALEMAHAIHAQLLSTRQIDKASLDGNLARFEQSLEGAEQAIRDQLIPLHHVDLFAYHNAFERFAEHYGLELAGVLTLNPELAPGAKHIAEVQTRLQNAHQPCLLTEPQFNRQWWRSITDGLDVTFSTWDPLATDIASDADGYVEFQLSIADAVARCLPEQAEH